MRLASVVNRVLAPADVRLVRARPWVQGLHLYPDRERPVRPRYLNVGAGNWCHPYWHNLDFLSEHYAAKGALGNIDLPHNLLSCDPLPVDDSSLALAYSSHVIEHLPDEDAQRLFRELRRVMAPTGIVRIVTPDATLVWRAYQRRDAAFFYWPCPYGSTTLAHRVLGYVATALLPQHPDGSPQRLSEVQVRDLACSLGFPHTFAHVTSLVPREVQQRHPHNHCSFWTFEKLRDALLDAGFSSVEQSAYGQSQSPLMRELSLFDLTHPAVSLYVEAVR